jgi:SHS2 domain-containing protein
VPKKYEFTEHTADLGLKAYGSSIEELFVHAAEGMFDVLVSTKNVEESKERVIDVEAMAVDNLMVSWLSELLYLYDTEHLVFSGFQIQRIENDRLKAIVRGEVLDPARHEIKTGIKAVTYHQLYLEETEAGWETQVIFDI